MTVPPILYVLAAEIDALRVRVEEIEPGICERIRREQADERGRVQGIASIPICAALRLLADRGVAV